MSSDDRVRATVSTDASVSIRLRPTRLLMFLRLRVEEATRELGLMDLKQKCEDTIRRFTLLGATQVEAGEPQDDDQAESDPMASFRTKTRTELSRPPDAPLPQRPAANTMLTASWSIDSLSPDQLLMLVDRLRYEATADPTRIAATPRTPTFKDPADEFRSVLEKLNRPTAPDLSPHFMYVARPNDEQVTQTMAAAHAKARKIAERLAQVAGAQLGELVSIRPSMTAGGRFADRFLNQQRCKNLMAVSSYQLQEDEIISDTPQSVELSISVFATYQLDHPQ